MCMSFSDLSIDRQEADYVEMLRYASEDGTHRDNYWARVLPRYTAELRDHTYAHMTTTELTTRKTELLAAHPHDHNWAALIQIITDVIDAREAVNA